MAVFWKIHFLNALSIYTYTYIPAARNSQHSNQRIKISHGTARPHRSCTRCPATLSFPPWTLPLPGNVRPSDSSEGRKAALSGMLVCELASQMLGPSASSIYRWVNHFIPATGSYKSPAQGRRVRLGIVPTPPRLVPHRPSRDPRRDALPRRDAGFTHLFLAASTRCP